MDRGRMSQIMQPGLIAPTVGSFDPGCQTQLGKDSFAGGTAYRGASVRPEEASLGRIWRGPFALIISQNLRQLWPDRHPSGFKELTLPDAKEALLQIHTSDLQPQRFTNPQTRPIKQQKQSPHGLG